MRTQKISSKDKWLRSIRSQGKKVRPLGGLQPLSSSLGSETVTGLTIRQFSTEKAYQNFRDRVLNAYTRFEFTHLWEANIPCPENQHCRRREGNF